jgi:hypothetical protein
MLTVADASDLPRITNPATRELVALRLQQLGSEASAFTELIIVEAGDAAQEIEQAAGFSILTDFDGLPFDHPDFCPCSEILEKFTYGNACIYEMVFIGNDDGAATAIFIPDTEGVDDDLLAMCRSFATPAVSTP